MFEHGWLINLIRDRECPRCHGTGFITQGMLRPYACDECNGTGIKGDPRLGAIVIALSVVTTIVPLVWWMMS